MAVSRAAILTRCIGKPLFILCLTDGDFASSVSPIVGHCFGETAASDVRNSRGQIGMRAIVFNAVEVTLNDMKVACSVRQS